MSEQRDFHKEKHKVRKQIAAIRKRHRDEGEREAAPLLRAIEQIERERIEADREFIRSHCPKLIGGCLVPPITTGES